MFYLLDISFLFRAGVYLPVLGQLWQAEKTDVPFCVGWHPRTRSLQLRANVPLEETSQHPLLWLFLAGFQGLPRGREMCTGRGKNDKNWTFNYVTYKKKKSLSAVELEANFRKLTERGKLVWSCKATTSETAMGQAWRGYLECNGTAASFQKGPGGLQIALFRYRGSAAPGSHYNTMALSFPAAASALPAQASERLQWGPGSPVLGF